MTEKTFNWEKLDKSLDLKGLKEDIEKARENGNYEEIPTGDYEVKVESMVLGQSKIKEDKTGGDPMLKIVFEILDGEFKGQKIFYNGVMQPNNTKAFGFQVHKNNELLRDLWDCDDNDVEFNGFKDYNELILDIADEVVDNIEYLLRKDKTKQGYDTYTILEIFD